MYKTSVTNEKNYRQSSIKHLHFKKSKRNFTFNLQK